MRRLQRSLISARYTLWMAGFAVLTAPVHAQRQAVTADEPCRQMEPQFGEQVSASLDVWRRFRDAGYALRVRVSPDVVVPVRGNTLITILQERLWTV